MEYYATVILHRGDFYIWQRLGTCLVAQLGEACRHHFVGEVMK